MYLENITVSGLRNVQGAKLSFGSRLNLIYGDNGSGKTSLLESIWLLGRGRSFRTRHLSAVIAREADNCVVAGSIRTDDGVECHLGVSRDKSGGMEVRADRQPVRNSSLLASILPLLLINSDSFSLLDGGPGQRRRFLDWIVFHVEPQSRPVWKEFSHIIKQRNSLLRRGKISQSELVYWNNEFISVAEQVNTFRQAWVDRLFDECRATLVELSGAERVEFLFQQGWSSDKTLAEQLEESYHRELKRGMTLVGPHRADIKITVEGALAKETLSRGQVKILASSMQVAQAKLMAAVTGGNPVALVDDLPAELDELHRNLVIDGLLNTGAQVFVTGVKLDEFFPDVGARTVIDIKQAALFHVEQGRFNAISEKGN